jgi:hypothetical protein
VLDHLFRPRSKIWRRRSDRRSAGVVEAEDRADRDGGIAKAMSSTTCMTFFRV